MFLGFCLRLDEKKAFAVNNFLKKIRNKLYFFSILKFVMEMVMLLKIKYVDFWENFDPENNSFQEIIENMGYKIELSEKPDYLFCSVFGHKALDEKYDNCVKIFFAGENVCPDFNLFDYAIGFEYMDFADRYLRCPLFYRCPSELWDAFLSKHHNFRQTLSKKSGFCSFVYSNGNADPIREQFFHELSKYKKVDSGGRYLNNIGMPDGVEDKIKFESKHKFSIAFENSSHPGYTTEKLISSFAATTVPIYWGDPRIKDVFNSDSFIFVNDFESLDAVVDKIEEIDRNDELYLKYLAAPALLDPEKFDKEKQKKLLKEFLFNIFRQEKEKAFRRNRVVWGKRYPDEMRRAFDALEDKSRKTVVEKLIYTLRREGLSGLLKQIKILFQK